MIEVTRDIGSSEEVIDALLQVGKLGGIIQVNVAATENWVNPVEVLQVPFQCLLLIKGPLWFFGLGGEIKTPAKGIVASKRRVFTDAAAQRKYVVVSGLVSPKLATLRSGMIERGLDAILKNVLRYFDGREITGSVSG